MLDSSKFGLGTLIKIGKRHIYIVVDDVAKWDALSDEEKRIQYRTWCEGGIIGDQQGIHQRD